MYFSAEPMTAEELRSFGAVLAVVPREDLQAETRRRAAAIVKHSPVTLRFAKRSLNRIENMELQAAYEFEQDLSGELSAHPDAKEAVRAFFERRPPRYSEH
jgi:enoyl-CoA hydratase